jgi:hypothetical protein
MAFGKAVAAEAFQLLEGLLGEFALVAVRHHAVDQLGAELRDAAGVLEGRHGAAQLVGLAGREAGAFDGHRIACSWNSGTPSVLPSTFSSSGLG